MANKKVKTGKKLVGEERIIDVLERFSAASLYMTTDLGQTDVAKILGMDNNRTNEVLKGVKKPPKAK